MSEGKVTNLVHIGNQRIRILNIWLEDYNCQMYEIPDGPSPEYIRVMVGDLDWLLESLEPDVGRDDEIFAKYIDVRSRLTEIHGELSVGAQA